MATRQCPFCGMYVSDYLTQCPFCRDALPKVPVVRSARASGHTEIRKGLLYMLLAAIIHFFAGGYSAMEVPFPINPLVTVYLSPVVFTGGLYLSLRGLYLHHKSESQALRSK